jgi:hypothetical protein
MCTQFLGQDLQKFSLGKPRGYANNTEINIRPIDFGGIRCMEWAVDSLQWIFSISSVMFVSYYATPNHSLA